MDCGRTGSEAKPQWLRRHYKTPSRPYTARVLKGDKWLQLAKEIAPSLTNASIMFNPKTAAGAGSYFRPSFETAASALGVQAIAHPVHDENEIEAAIIELSAMPSSGLL